MRDEKEVQAMADRAATLINRASASANVEVLMAIRDALDWVLDENMDDPV